MTEVIPAPLHYDIDADKIFEMVERKDLSKLQDLGGQKGLAKILQTDLDNGINPDSVHMRKEQFGINVLNKKDPVTFLEFLIEAFQDMMVQILCVAAVISIIFGMTLKNPHTGEVDREKGWIEGTAIIISVAIVTLTGSINNFQKAKKFEEMERDQSIKEMQVLRGGSEISIESPDLVVGDILVTEGGLQMNCDCLFVHGSDFKCNEAAMTGEPDIIDKNYDHDPFFLSGTLMEEGTGRLLVVAVGMNSYEGKMKESTDEDSGDTPLQEHLEVLADQIGKLGFAGAFVLVIALCIKEGILIAQDGKDANASNFLNFLIVAITLVVVAIPEGLPLAVTISLAFSMKAMMADHCLVRVLASCETMGAATAVCSDKTGTLTTNVMTVVQGLMMEEEFLYEGYGLHIRDEERVNQVNRDDPRFSTKVENIDRYCFAIAINSTARENKDSEGNSYWVGNKTEHGLLGFVNQMGRSYVDMRQSVLEDNMKQFPFNSKKKRMTTVVKDQTGSLTAYTKGASETILEDSDRYTDADGYIKDLDDEKRALFNSIIEDIANQGNRTIGIAFSPCTYSELPDEEPSGSLVFMGVMGIQDPIRPEVPDAVLACQSAGLHVRMVTGDNINTAIAIAKKCNIYGDNGYDLAMLGVDFRKLYEEDKDKLADIVPRIRILARSSPQDKYILVGMLQEIGDVVGVTGDGTNDAPALKLADVGFAMQVGTDIAKGASDMVLLDNNFASVVNAIMWGRAVNDNIRKFLQFQLSINVGGVLLTIIGSLASENSKEPFNPVMLLWLNLIMDTMAALALATERPEKACLERPPVYKQAPLISNKMRGFIGIHSFYQTVLILLLLFFGHKWFGIIEEPDRCDVADFGTIETVQNKSFVNQTTNETYYNLTTVLEDNPTKIWCEKQCTDHGGVYDGRECMQGLTHSTLVFNTFIFMQIFNIFNARKIYDEVNPFEGIFSRSKMLLKVFWVILLFQLFAVEVTGPFMEVTGLSPIQWAISVGFGAIELVLGFVPRLLPISNYVPTEVVEKHDKEHLLKKEHLKPDHQHLLFVHHDPSLKHSHAHVNK